MTRLLELIARHEAVSEEASEDMLRIMRRLDGRGELTRLLPWNEMNMLPDPQEELGRGEGRLVHDCAHFGSDLPRDARALRDVGVLRRRHGPRYRVATPKAMSSMASWASRRGRRSPPIVPTGKRHTLVPSRAYA